MTFVLDSFFSHGHAVFKRQRTRGFDKWDNPVLYRLNEGGLLREVLDIRLAEVISQRRNTTQTFLSRHD